MFQFGGAWSFIWGVSPQNPPRGDGLLLHWRDEYICFTPSCAPHFATKLRSCLCNTYYQNETPKAETRTEKHWQSSPDTYLLDYEVVADWLRNSAFYPSRFMPDGSGVTTVPWRKNEQCFQRLHRLRLPYVKCAKWASISSSNPLLANRSSVAKCQLAHFYAKFKKFGIFGGGWCKYFWFGIFVKFGIFLNNQFFDMCKMFNFHEDKHFD